MHACVCLEGAMSQLHEAFCTKIRRWQHFSTERRQWTWCLLRLNALNFLSRCSHHWVTVVPSMTPNRAHSEGCVRLAVSSNAWLHEPWDEMDGLRMTTRMMRHENMLSWADSRPQLFACCGTTSCFRIIDDTEKHIYRDLRCFQGLHDVVRKWHCVSYCCLLY